MSDASTRVSVIPAKAGIQRRSHKSHWGARERARAFAGTTGTYTPSGDRQ